VEGLSRPPSRALVLPAEGRTRCADRVQPQVQSPQRVGVAERADEHAGSAMAVARRRGCFGQRLERFGQRGGPSVAHSTVGERKHLERSIVSALRPFQQSMHPSPSAKHAITWPRGCQRAALLPRGYLRCDARSLSIGPCTALQPPWCGSSRQGPLGVCAKLV
jgi:hypothetical protein